MVPVWSILEWSVNDEDTRQSQPSSHYHLRCIRQWGGVAFTGNKWFQLKWVEKLEKSHITVKELAPIVTICTSRNQEAMHLCSKMFSLCQGSVSVLLLTSGGWRIFLPMPFHMTT